MKCPYCGADCNEQSNFCETCGKAFTKNNDSLQKECMSDASIVDNSTSLEGEAGARYCQRCGNLIESGMSACPVCGWCIDEAATNFPFPDDDLAQKKEKIDRYFKSWRLWLILGIPTCSLGFIVSMVFGYMLLYQYWKFIPDSESKTTPGEAVGFLFIPFFSLYWVFVAYWQFSKMFQKVYKLKNDKTAKLALAYCICALASALPYLGVMAIIASWILSIIWNVAIYRQVSELMNGRLAADDANR